MAQEITPLLMWKQKRNRRGRYAEPLLHPQTVMLLAVASFIASLCLLVAITVPLAIDFPRTNPLGADIVRHLPMAGPRMVPWKAPAKQKAVAAARPAGLPSQYFKDTVAAACRARWAGEQATLCYVRLLAMARQESGFDPKAVGDQGRSHGAYQIRTDLPGRPSVRQAEDVAFAVEWTLDHLVAHGYPEKVDWSLQAHNGIVLAAPHPFEYAAKVRAIAKRFLDIGL